MTCANSRPDSNIDGECGPANSNSLSIINSSSVYGIQRRSVTHAVTY